MTDPAVEPRPQRRLALLLMTASGFAGLGYQIVWTRQLALGLGQETVALLAVVAAFFGGLAFGALLLGGRIERSARPERWYAACEAVIGAWALVLLVAGAPATAALQAAIGTDPGAFRHWAVAFVGAALLLLPATAAMGATLPALATWSARFVERGSAIAGLYAANTLGAVFGVLAGAFWLLPSFGLARTAALCAVINLACAAIAWRLHGGPPRPTAPAPANPARGRVLWLLAATGLFGIGYEVVVLRALSQVFENTVYTFALVLAVYLVGTALGAAAYQATVRQRGFDSARGDRLLLALPAAGGLGAASLWLAPGLKGSLLAAATALAGNGMAAALLAETAVALLAFGPPTLLMGALFSQLCDQARHAGVGYGRAVGFNTLAAACAPPLFGVLALPWLGAGLAILTLLGAYLLLVSRRAWARPLPWVLAASAIGAAGLAPPLRLVDVPPGGQLLAFEDGATAAVSVLEDAQGVRSLHIDNRQQEGSSATRWADGRQAWLPLLLHPAPRQALFLGVGTGVTAAAAASHSRLQVTAVELVPEVLALTEWFVPAESLPPRLRWRLGDARRFVRTDRGAYDVIVADNFHPARSGSGALYTVEHFAAVRTRLAAGGLFCQWLPLHQMDLDTLRSVVRSFQAVFPEARAVLATHSLLTPVLGLVGAAGDFRIDPLALSRAQEEAAAGGDGPAGFGLAGDLPLLGSFVAGPASLARFAGAAALNTDDHPVVAYRAPRLAYAPDSTPADRLLTLVNTLQVAPAELLTDGADPALAQRLQAYLRARNLFLAAGRDVKPRADVRAMLAQVREPLLAVLRTSPDFSPAREPLLRMAHALGRDDPAAARALLHELPQVRELAPLQPAGADVPAATAARHVPADRPAAAAATR